MADLQRTVGAGPIIRHGHRPDLVEGHGGEQGDASTWTEFLRSQAEGILATDFFTVETVGLHSGEQTSHLVLAVMMLSGFVAVPCAVLVARRMVAGRPRALRG